MKLFYLISLFSILQTNNALEFKIPETLQSVSKIVEGIIESASDPLQPQYVFKTIKNAVEGLPFQIGYAVANFVCEVVIARGKARTPDLFTPKLEDIKFQFRTACDKREYPIADPSGLRNDADFDPKKKTVIFATGWTSTVNSKRHDALSKAYNCRGDTNYLALDVGGYINTLYIWSSQNTVAIGKYLAEGIQRLESIIDIDDLHLMGHSLGAQIMGSAARHYRELTGKTLRYLTGLDPASPCFNGGEVLTVISASDAEFVDIIHTDPGVRGVYESVGHADFYVGGKFPIQDACHDTKCSHGIAVNYYTESVYPNNVNNFLSTLCNSLNSLQQGKCKGKKYPMGYAVPHDLRGSYVLEVNAKKPYGKNATAAYTDPDTSTCGRCPRLK